MYCTAGNYKKRNAEISGGISFFNDFTQIVKYAALKMLSKCHFWKLIKKNPAAAGFKD